MAYLSWQLTLVFLLLTPVVGLIVRKASLRFRKTSVGIQNSMASITEVATEAFQGHRIVKAYNGYQHENRSFEIANFANRRQVMRKALVASASVPLLIFIAGATVALMIYLAMSGVMVSFVSAGTFVSYLGAILLLMGPIKRLARVNEYLQTGIAAAHSTFLTLDESVEESGGRTPVRSLEGGLEFRNVSFRYSQDKPLALDDLSFKIQNGQTVALVGASGSGKSSIIALLLGFYSLQEGDILIAGTPISECSREGLRAQFGFAPQEAMLFNGTIKENVAYGQGQVDERILTKVVEATRIDSFSESLPSGLDGAVGEQGVRLSGGQRQRLSIARALYRQAPVLILDEATSALDTESESLIRAAIKTLAPEQTVLIIAHRLSTIVDADFILVLQDGRLVESGSHNDLIKLEGRYFELHRAQENGSESIGGGRNS
jgi:subfamily B ATP-binding cassette protein MsbA